MASRRLRPMLKKFFEEIGQPEMQRYLPKTPLFMGQYTRRFIKIMNQIAREQGKSIWLEKTPEHLHYIDYIEKFVPEAKIIHIVRSGSAVVASLYDMAQKYPQSWWGTCYREIDWCIDGWIAKIEITRNHLHKPNHQLVRYEQLVENPAEVLAELCEFIGVERDEGMLQDYRKVAKQLIRDREEWKVSVRDDIQNANAKKFCTLFDETQQQYIRDRLSGISLDELSAVQF
jgi:hypothetical protein